MCAHLRCGVTRLPEHRRRAHHVGHGQEAVQQTWGGSCSRWCQEQPLSEPVGTNHKTLGRVVWV